MSNDRAYCVNVAGVRRQDIQKWSEGYFSPVSGDFFERLADQIIEAFFASIPTGGDRQFSELFFRAHIKVIYMASWHLFELKKLQQLRSQGFEWIDGEDRRRLDGQTIVETGMRFWRLRAFQKSRKELLKDYARTVKYNLFAAPPRQLPSRLSLSVFLVGRMSPEMRSYCDATHCDPFVLFPYLFSRMPVDDRKRRNALQDIDHFMEAFFGRVRKICDFAPEDVFQKILSPLRGYFAESAVFMLQAIGVLGKCRTGALLTSPLGDITLRLFSAAWRYSGGEVTGFIHGNLLGHFDPGSSLIDGTVIHRYMVNSRGECEAGKFFFDSFHYAVKPVAIDCVSNRIYRTIYESNRGGVAARPVKTVMFIGFPMDPMNIMYKWFPGQHALAHLHLELGLVKLLSNKGYRVIYKAHPDQKEMIAGLFDRHAVSIECGRFEDVYRQADCILFGHSNTSTFGYAVLTGKPMVLIDVKGKIWYPRFRELLSGRCALVDAACGDDGRITYDETALIDAINRSPDRMSEEVIREFALN